MERLERKQCRPSITQTANLERLPRVPASFFTSIITPRPPPTRLSPRPTHRPAPDTSHRRFINYGFCWLFLLLPCRRIRQHSSCHPRGAAQLGQGSSWDAFPASWGAPTPPLRWRWDGGGRDAGLCNMMQGSKAGVCEGRLFPFMKGSDLLSDLHPTETKCQYCWTYLAPPEVQSYSEQCLV